ncbi:hypothetical protein [Streptomyces parvulus]|uniref:hypothetical protein n=1 Tax=Streptomyces parvulus TaxID=146923 RepID=UPI00382AAC0C
MTTSTETAGDVDGGALPPYSGEDAVCPKCQNEGAFTFYRPARGPWPAEVFNGIMRRTPLPERLERDCQRCSFKWDESLVAELPGMTVDALAHALAYAIGPQEVILQAHREVAANLLHVVRITARPEHPMWQYSQGRPEDPVQPQDEPEPVKETTR